MLSDEDVTSLHLEDVHPAGFAGLAEFFHSGRVRLSDPETCGLVRAAAEAYGVGGVLGACALFDKLEAARVAQEAEVAALIEHRRSVGGSEEDSGAMNTAEYNEFIQQWNE